MGIFSHITGAELAAALMGIIFVWSLRYSKEKDKSDEIDKAFSLKKWASEWIRKKKDNIFIHVFFAAIPWSG